MAGSGTDSALGINSGVIVNGISSGITEMWGTIDQKKLDFTVIKVSDGLKSTKLLLTEEGI